MAERFRSALETLINVRDETNGLAPAGEERRRRRNESIEELRTYSVPALFLLVGAGVIATAAHFLVWSLVSGILMPLIYAAVPDLKTVNVGSQVLQLGQFISYVLYAAGMVGIATVVLRGVLAKPSGYVRERTRTCTACGMTVLESATRCRYCGSPLTTRRAYGPPSSRSAGPTLSSSRASSSSDRDDGPQRRGRRGGRRRGGRGRSRSGSGSGGGSGAPSGASSPRSDG